MPGENIAVKPHAGAEKLHSPTLMGRPWNRRAAPQIMPTATNSRILAMSTGTGDANRAL